MNWRWIPVGNDRVLAIALGTSILLHAIALAVHFTFPTAPHPKSSEARLDVVLVNTQTRERPSRADVLAQANLDRGGNVDERRRARSPLPVTNPRQPGRDLAEAQRRVQELEAQQQQLLAQAKQVQSRVPTPAPRTTPSEQATTQPSGRDLADLALAAIRLQAQIDKQIDEYQKRPRKKFIGANAAEYRFAQYEEDWRAKVERWGTVNYPSEARGKLYGNLRLTVTIRPDGSVDSIELDRSSGLKILDAAAFKIVKMAAPFASFPASIRRDTDLLVITRTWFFSQGDKLWTE
ncbi:MAG TPA: TonB family protein [Burkholderiales bacterium]|nr:TonB family protein [Burkholderiales bacterium]